MYKLLVFISIFLLNFFAVHANLTFTSSPVDSTHQVISNHIEKKEWLIALDDNTLWQVLPLTKRKQTWYEWWYNIIPLEWSLEEEFFFDPKTWLNAEIQIYSLEEEIFEGYKYLIQNVETGKCAFAQIIPFGAKLGPFVDYAVNFLTFPLNHSTPIKDKYSLQDIVILKDYSCWKVLRTSAKNQFFGGWWYNSKNLKPNSLFATSLHNWQESDLLQVFYYIEENDDDLKYGIDQQIRILYLIENQTQNQLVHVRPLKLFELEALYADLFRKEYKRGYNNGTEDGRLDGQK